MRPRVLCYTMLAAFAGTVARAEIFEWRDKDGVKHFTNNTQSVPAEYRSSVQVMMENKSGVQAPPEAIPAATPGRARHVGSRVRRHGKSAE